MKRFEIRAIEIAGDYDYVFHYIADPRNLPEWTNAFHSVSEDRAVMKTPNGSLEIELQVTASRQHGNIDWLMIFPDGSRATAYSRLVRLEEGKNVYSFILTPPPVPLDQLEGTLEQQSEVLKEELERLQSLLGHRK